MTSSDSRPDPGVGTGSDPVDAVDQRVDQRVDDVVRALRAATEQRRRDASKQGSDRGSGRGPGRAVRPGVGAGSGSARDEGRHRRRRSTVTRRFVLAARIVAVGAVALVLVLAGLSVLDRPGPAPVSGRDPWVEVVTALDDARLRAWTTHDEAALRAVVVPGTSFERTELAALRRWRSSGLVPRGLRVDVGSAGVVSRDGSTVVLDVVDERSAYEVVDTEGRVVETVPARGRRAWRVRLRSPDANETRRPWRWQVAEVRPIGVATPPGARR